MCVLKGEDYVRRRLSKSGANQEQMDGVMTPFPFGAALQLPLKIPACGFVQV